MVKNRQNQPTIDIEMRSLWGGVHITVLDGAPRSSQAFRSSTDTCCLEGFALGYERGAGRASRKTVSTVVPWRGRVGRSAGGTGHLHPHAPLRCRPLCRWWWSAHTYIPTLQYLYRILNTNTSYVHTYHYTRTFFESANESDWDIVPLRQLTACVTLVWFFFILY